MATRDFYGILNTTKWVDTNDETKAILLDLNGVDTGTTRTYTVPNSDTTLVGTDVTQTLTNKTLTGTTNDIAANKLRVTGGNTVDLSSAPVPVAGQLLSAVSGTTGEWKTLPGADFGNDYFYVQQDTEITTNSTTLIPIFALNTPSLQGGDYRITISYDWLYESETGAKFMEIHVDMNGTMLLNHEEHIITKEKWFNFNTFIVKNVSPGVHMINFKMKTSFASSAAHIRDVRFEIWEIKPN